MIDFLILPLLGATFGLFTAVVAFWLLGAFFWFPYWNELRDLGTYSHDVEWTYLVGFVPIIVAVLFAVVTAVSSGFYRSSLRTVSIKRLTFILLAVPAWWAIGANIVQWRREGFWSYPLAEVSLLLIAAAWAYILARYQTGSWGFR